MSSAGCTLKEWLHNIILPTLQMNALLKQTLSLFLFPQLYQVLRTNSLLIGFYSYASSLKLALLPFNSSLSRQQQETKQESTRSRWLSASNCFVVLQALCRSRNEIAFVTLQNSSSRITRDGYFPVLCLTLVLYRFAVCCYVLQVSCI